MERVLQTPEPRLGGMGAKGRQNSYTELVVGGMVGKAERKRREFGSRPEWLPREYSERAA